MKQEKGSGDGEGGCWKNKLGRWLGAPVRALSRACDTYVRKMLACAGSMPAQYGGAGGRAGYGGPNMQQAAMFSSRSTRHGPDGGDDDLSELIRTMSQRQQQRERDVQAATVQARSRSVAVGRIDEDAPLEFGADAGSVGLPPRAVRRSRSAAVGGGVGAGLPPRVGGGGGFGASAVTRKAAGGVGAGLPPRVGGFGPSAVTKRALGGGIVHGG